MQYTPHTPQKLNKKLFLKKQLPVVVGQQVAAPAVAALLPRTSWFALTSQVCCPAPARPTTFCPRVNISHCCCRWCVMRGTECSLCSPGVGTVVCGSQTCGVS